MKIPKIFHQVWFNFLSPGEAQHPPKKEAELTRGWLRKHPDWDYMLWNERTCRDLISAHYSWFLETYDSFEAPIHKVDAVRYFILDHYGGIAMDFDFVCYRNIEELFLEKDREVYLVPEPQLHCTQQQNENNFKHSTLICNGWVASAPKASFWQEALFKLEASYEHELPGVIHQTGPGFISRAYFSYEGKQEIEVIPSILFFPGYGHGFNWENLENEAAKHGSYAAHLWHGSWI